MDLSVKVSSEYYCGSYKVYLNFWVTDFGGCDRVQIKANISVFGWGCPSPTLAHHHYKATGRKEKTKPPKEVIGEFTTHRFCRPAFP